MLQRRFPVCGGWCHVEEEGQIGDQLREQSECLGSNPVVPQMSHVTLDKPLPSLCLLPTKWGVRIIPPL